MKMIPWFKVFTNQLPVTERASDESAGRAYKAMLRYAANRTEPSFDDDICAELLFVSMRPYIEESLIEYAAKLAGSKKGGQKNKENIERIREALQEP